MTTIERMQQGLEKALVRASQADDREVAARIREEGHRIVFLFNGLLGMSRMYDVDNAAFDAPSREFAAALRSLLELLGADRKSTRLNSSHRL